MSEPTEAQRLAAARDELLALAERLKQGGPTELIVASIVYSLVSVIQIPSELIQLHAVVHTFSLASGERLRLAIVLMKQRLSGLLN